MLPRPTAPTLLLAAALTAAAVPAVASAASGGTSAATTTGAASSPAATTTASAPAKASSGRSRAVNKRPSYWGLVRASRLTVRAAAGTGSRVGTVRSGDRLRIRCQVNGTRASGKYGYSRVWNRIKLANGRTGYVPDAAIETASKNALVAAYCGYPDPPAPTGDNPQQGRCSSVATVALDPAPADRATFVAAAGPLARASRSTTGVPASVTLAQAILESASGTSTAGANNYFGIKAQLVSPGVYRWGTEAVGCVHKQTMESESGAFVRQIGQFRMYRGMQASFDDHGLFLRQNARYAKAFDHTDDPAQFAKEIHRAGYATDPSYSSLLIKLMTDKTLPLIPWDAA
ncbi:glucosaminidase domain-containing protein [Patulibacter sp. SYSU D01012]|uniref:glucosaminidase domain-containing protein n=1 Tax=Patulibacter sp. SYSU D01012 TaxID=2817381 RepID=UPI001B316EBC|nr:glucosaminidase domain-containing protein [Patulibacter sp. SYSU D01012]